MGVMGCRSNLLRSPSISVFTSPFIPIFQSFLSHFSNLPPAVSVYVQLFYLILSELNRTMRYPIFSCKNLPLM